MNFILFFRGTEKQVEKNKRKCVHLKEEIENMKVKYNK
jgi:hypothetical protein